MQKIIRAVFFLSLLFLVACGGGKKVSRIDPNAVVDLSGRWNDTDSRLVADEMIKDCLSRPWYSNMIQQKGANPTVVIGKVRNKSHEHINIETFIKDMERALINSGTVDFVANAAMRDELRDEIASQAGNATEETRKDAGQEIGADLMLTGSLNSIIDQDGGEQVIFYQIDLELIDLQSHRKVWIGDKKIKKYISRDAVKL
ncbi:MAG TPA: penicillin-binding protein activator LpoB [Fibrobacteraceae bacterium]|nr:penicillin-binding protein activator LpoB [Fibrobacteraceae bacterium]